MLDRAFVVEFWEVDLEKYPTESGENGIKEEINDLKELILSDLSRNGVFLGYTMEDVKSAIRLLKEKALYEDLKCLNSEILKPFDLHFGYRVVNEIALFFKNAEESKNKGIISFRDDKEILDYAVLMKILPKFHGNRGKLETPLCRMLAWAVDPKNWRDVIKEIAEKDGGIKNDPQKILPGGPDELYSEITKDRGSVKYERTAEKIVRMLYQLYTTGFTSFL